jgi:polar amino acid transport system substrate-binding protein
MYADEPIVGYAVSQNSGKVENAGRNVAPAPQGIVVRKDNADLEGAMKTALKAMITDGKYLEILKKWGVESGAYTTGV